MSTYLIHHGILGQRWGVRRFQNPDGSLTKAGKKRYAKETMKKLQSDPGQKQRIALDMGTAAVYITSLPAIRRKKKNTMRSIGKLLKKVVLS